MSSIMLCMFNPKLVQDRRPIGKNSVEESPKQTLSFVKLTVPADNDIPEYSVFSVARKGELPPNVSHISDDLGDIARTFNRSIPQMFGHSLQDNSRVTPYKWDADRFVTQVNALIKKRNDKIDASGWIAFLDVVLKILTLGLFSYKESLKAPLLNPRAWANTFDPAQYQFSSNFQIAASAGPIDEAKSIEQFFHTPLLPIPACGEPGIDEAALKFAKNVLVEIPPQQQTVESRPILENSRWECSLMEKLTNATSLQIVTTSSNGDQLISLKETTHKQCQEINDLFNQGFISNGLLILNSNQAKIAIRKTDDGEFALLVLGSKTRAHMVGAPLHLFAVLREQFRLDFDSRDYVLFIPQGPLLVSLPEPAKPGQQ